MVDYMTGRDIGAYDAARMFGQPSGVQIIDPTDPVMGRYVPQSRAEASAISSFQRQVAAATPESNANEGTYHQQALSEEVAKYLAYDYGRDNQKLQFAAQSGDYETVKDITDRMRSFTDKNFEALTRWEGIRDGGTLGKRMAESASALLNGSYLGQSVSAAGTGARGDVEGAGAYTIGAFLAGRSPEGLQAQQRHLVSTLGLTNVQAEMLSNPDSPWYSVFSSMLQDYNSTKRLMPKGQLPDDQSSVGQARVNLQKWTSFVERQISSGQGDSEVIKAFVNNASRIFRESLTDGDIDATFTMFKNWQDRHKDSNPDGFFRDWQQGIAAASPQEQQLVRDGQGVALVPVKASGVSKERARNGVLAVGRRLDSQNKFTDWLTVGSAYGEANRSAKVLAEFIGMPLDAIGAGSIVEDAAVQRLVGGPQPTQLQRAITQAETWATRLGWEVDQATGTMVPTHDIGTQAILSKKVVSTLAQSALRGWGEDDTVKELANALSPYFADSRVSPTQVSNLARALYDEVNTDGAAEPLHQILRKLAGQVKDVVNPDGSHESKEVIPPNLQQVSLATGEKMREDEDPLNPGLCSTDPKHLAKIDDRNLQAQARLRDCASQDNIGFTETEDGRDARKGLAQHMLRVQQKQAGGGENPETRQMSWDAGHLMLENWALGFEDFHDEVLQVEGLVDFVKDGSLITLLERHDQQWNRSSDPDLLSRTFKVLGNLTTKLRDNPRANPGLYNLWAQMMVAAMAGRPTILRDPTDSPFVDSLQFARDTLAVDTRKWFSWNGDSLDISPEDAQGVLSSLLDKCAVYTTDSQVKNNILSAVGYHSYPLGVRMTHADYGGILHYYDVMLRKRGLPSVEAGSGGSGSHPVTAPNDQSQQADDVRKLSIVLMNKTTPPDAMQQLIGQNLTARLGHQTATPEDTQVWVQRLMPQYVEYARQNGVVSALEKIEKDTSRRFLYIPVNDKGEVDVSHGSITGRFWSEEELQELKRKFGYNDFMFEQEADTWKAKFITAQDVYKKSLIWNATHPESGQ